MRYRDFIVSSTRVRRLVAEGRVDEAGALLGRVYAIEGTVVEGRRRGRELGFPTANLETPNELMPPHGVYATMVTIDGVRARRGHQHRHAADIWRNGRPPSRRTSWRDVGDLYGRSIRVAFIQRLRDERRFEDVDALRTQIDADRRARRAAVRPPGGVSADRERTWTPR